MMNREEDSSTSSDASSNNEDNDPHNIEYDLSKQQTVTSLSDVIKINKQKIKSKSQEKQ